MRGCKYGPSRFVRVVVRRSGRLFRWRLMAGEAQVVCGLEGTRDAARTAGRLAKELYEARNKAP